MKRTKLSLLTVIRLLASWLLISVIMVPAYGQVPIGSETAAQNFSALELISNHSRGLRLPQLTQAQREALEASANFVAEKTGKALGLQIFNLDTRCVETWNGVMWIQGCPEEGPHVPPASLLPSSCGITASNGNTTFTCIADPAAEMYEFFVNGASQGKQMSNIINFTTAQTPSQISVAYFYPPYLLRPKMIDIVGGTYIIGAAVASATDFPGNNGALTNSHQVTLSSFKMSETTVTQLQYAIVMGANPSCFQCDGGDVAGSVNYAPSSQKPVDYVNWYRAIAYCNKLSLLEGKTPCYSVSGISDWANLAYSSIPISPTPNSTWDAAVCNWSANGYRLPTEAEWEYAARGGALSLTQQGTPPDFFYSGSNTGNDVAWYNVNNGTSGSTTYGTKIVKQKIPNALGLYDMSGNVWEWCWDWYADPYESGAVTDPHGPNSGIYRVIRGGPYASTWYNNRVSLRHYIFPNSRFDLFGFRLVLPVH
jgi:formylglycine-generating enzyme required for sulfatase activity